MADKLNLPKAKFAHEVATGATDPAMKAAGAKAAGKVHMVPVEKIKVIPGFNVRVESPDYIQHRDNLVASITANGYDPTKPIAGYVGKDGDIFVTDGHTRLDAVTIVNQGDGDEIEAIPVVVHPKEVSLTDLTVALHTANNGRPLTPFELGIVVKRLLAEDGAVKKDIAARLGVTTRYLDDVLLLAGADKAIKQHVAAGEVSSTMAIQLLRKDADTAAEKIAEAVKKAAGTGKKATKKMTGPKMQTVKVAVAVEADADMKDIVKAAAAAIREAIPAKAGDEDTKLSTVDGSITLTISVPAPEKPKPAAPKGKKAKADKPAAKKSKDKKSTDETAEVEKVVKKAKGKTKPKASAEGEDDVPAKLPPKVKSDENVPDDEEVDI